MKSWHYDLLDCPKCGTRESVQATIAGGGVGVKRLRGHHRTAMKKVRNRVRYVVGKCLSCKAEITAQDLWGDEAPRTSFIPMSGVGLDKILEDDEE